MRVLYSLVPLNNHDLTFFISWFEEERRLDIDEKPLVVQLNWNKDDREGRFVLKNENDALPPKVGPLHISRWRCPRPGSAQDGHETGVSVIGLHWTFLFAAFPKWPFYPPTWKKTKRSSTSLCFILCFTK